MTVSPRHLSHGFSLLELAIALSILAVLAGGFLKGRELLLSSRAQGVMDQLQGVETALAAFEAKYGGLPGDFDNANGAVPGAAGDSSGSIDLGTESGSVFAQLASAGLIKGTYSVIDASKGCSAVACPKSPFGSLIEVSSSLNRLANPGETTALEISTGGKIPAKQLAEIDRKIDDGNPRTGSFRGHSGQSFGACVTDTGWNEVANPKNCAGVYLVN